eukprot:gb/GFBE01058666.1/.p1 GENE.gb/GFBE01058666.1/~~gb/GFBE01058666.1/.p1  ORF type:complete len:132 (+),score=33.05 gb/GFBE01058666.1/:1-396(+)
MRTCLRAASARKSTSFVLLVVVGFCLDHVLFLDADPAIGNFKSQMLDLQALGEAEESEAFTLMQLTMSQEEASPMVSLLGSMKRRFQGGSSDATKSAFSEACSRRATLLATAVLSFALLQTSAQDLVLMSI